MALLTKNQLSASNASSFPDNTSGLITPQILRDFNTNIIDSLVDSLATSSYALTDASNTFTQENNFTSISASSFVSASEFVGDGSKITGITASVALPILDEGILQGYATSMNFTGSAINAQVIAGTAVVRVNVEGAGFVSTSSFNEYTASNDSKVNSLISATGSYAISSSVAAVDAAQQAQINSLIAQTGSNDNTSLNAFTASQESKDNTLATYTASVDTKFSTIGTYTGSNDTKWNTLGGQSGSWVTESETGSFARTNASNTFTGVQQFNDGIRFDDSSRFIEASGADLNMASYAGKLNLLSNSEIVINPVTGLTTITGSVLNVTAPNAIFNTISGSRVSASFFVGDGSGLTNLPGAVPLTSLNAFTQSQDTKNSTLATYTASVDSSLSNINSFTASNANTSLNAYTASNDTKWSNLAGQSGSWVTSAITASSIITASVNVDDITFTKGDGSQFTITVATGSAVSASYAETSSITNNVIVIARNGGASTLGAGTVVHITSAVGDNPVFTTASYDTEALSSNTFGILRYSSPSGADVQVVVSGIVTGVNTDPALGYVAGDIIYLSSSGQFTNIQPQAPNQIVTLGQVLRAQQNNGSIYVSINNGWELNELHNVQINNPLTGDLLQYESSSYGLWKNKSIAGAGITTTSSFNTYTQSVDNKFATLGSLTGSFATTGSNTFNGNQVVNGDIQTINGAITSSNGFISPGGLTIANINGTGIQYGGTSTNVNVAATPTDIFAGHVVDGGTPEAAVKIVLSSYNAPYSGQTVPTIYAGGYYDAGLGYGSIDTTMTFYSSSIQMWMPTNLKAGLEVTGSTNIQNLTASLQQGYVWVGNANGKTTTVATSSFGTTINTGSFATTGSNSFNGNQTITGSFIQSGSNTIAVAPNGASVGTWIQNRVLISGPSSGQTPRLYISGSDGAFSEFGRGFITQDTRKNPSLGSSIYQVGPLNTECSNIVSVANDDYSIDVELMLFANTSSIGFSDFDNGSTFTYVPFMKLAPNNGDNPPVEFKRSVQVTGSLNVSSTITASLQQGYVWVGDASGRTTTVATSSFGGALPSDLISSSAQITALGFVSSSITASSIVTASVNLNTITFTKGDASTFNLTVDTGSGGGGAAFPYTGNAVITGSLGISGSMFGGVVALSVATATASVDFSAANMFTLTLPSASTHINPTNIRAGQTVNIQITQPTPGTGSVTFPSNVKFAGGNDYQATATGSAIDMLTLVSYDGTNVLATSIKNFL